MDLTRLDARFDARAAKLLAPGEHLRIDGCPGLRLQATATRRTWTYRYRSPQDGRMRQVLIGIWPAMSFPSASAQWEVLRSGRTNGQDPALAKRRDRLTKRDAAIGERARQQRQAYTVRRLCDDYLHHHVDRLRKAKGAAEVRRMFNTMLNSIAEVPAKEVSRAQAFDLLESYQDIPVQAAKLRAELGAAWDLALDAGRIPESASNWWRQLMRGRLRSTGKRIEGVSQGAVKRALSDEEAGRLIRWLPNFSRTVS